MIYALADEYDLDGDLMTKIVFCESGFNPLAKSQTSTATGLAQFIIGTWNRTPQGKAGRSRLEAEANLSAMAWLMDKEGTPPWNASKHCWSK